MTGKELIKLYILNFRHKQWENIDMLIYRIAEELDKVESCGCK
jgi:hypothetical protein